MLGNLKKLHMSSQNLQNKLESAEQNKHISNLLFVNLPMSIKLSSVKHTYEWLDLQINLRKNSMYNLLRKVFKNPNFHMYRLDNLIIINYLQLTQSGQYPNKSTGVDIGSEHTSTHKFLYGSPNRLAPHSDEEL
jgi:hypothetical protein